MVSYDKPFDALTLSDLQTVGFSSELHEYLSVNHVSKDEVVAELEARPDLSLAAAIGNIKTTRQIQGAGEIQAGSPEHATLSAEQDAAAQAEPVVEPVEEQKSSGEEVAAE